MCVFVFAYAKNRVSHDAACLCLTQSNLQRLSIEGLFHYADLIKIIKNILHLVREFKELKLNGATTSNIAKCNMKLLEALKTTLLNKVHNATCKAKSFKRKPLLKTLK